MGKKKKYSLEEISKQYNRLQNLADLLQERINVLGHMILVLRGELGEDGRLTA